MWKTFPTELLPDIEEAVRLRRIVEDEREQVIELVLTSRRLIEQSRELIAKCERVLRE